jgi:dolichol kinase
MQELDEACRHPRGPQSCNGQGEMLTHILVPLLLAARWTCSTPLPRLLTIQLRAACFAPWLVAAPHHLPPCLTLLATASATAAAGVAAAALALPHAWLHIQLLCALPQTFTAGEAWLVTAAAWHGGVFALSQIFYALQDGLPAAYAAGADARMLPVLVLVLTLLFCFCAALPLCTKFCPWSTAVLLAQKNLQQPNCPHGGVSANEPYVDEHGKESTGAEEIRAHKCGLQRNPSQNAMKGVNEVRGDTREQSDKGEAGQGIDTQQDWGSRPNIMHWNAGGNGDSLQCRAKEPGKSRDGTDVVPDPACKVVGDPRIKRSAQGGKKKDTDKGHRETDAAGLEQTGQGYIEDLELEWPRSVGLQQTGSGGCSRSGLSLLQTGELGSHSDSLNGCSTCTTLKNDTGKLRNGVNCRGNCVLIDNRVASVWRFASWCNALWWGLLVLFALIYGCSIAVAAAEALQQALGSGRRRVIVALWSTVLAVALPAMLFMARAGSVRHVILRKGFHVLAIVLFAPVLVVDAEFLGLALGVALTLMVVTEALRALGVPGVRFLGRYMDKFTDCRDTGTVTISHMSLLFGIAGPLWLAPTNQELTGTGLHIVAWAGLLTLGVADSMAAVVGSTLGRIKMHPLSHKTLEGTLASALSLWLCLEGVVAAGWAARPAALVAWKLPWISGVTALLEASTTQLDNLVVPLIASSLMLVLL